MLPSLYKKLGFSPAFFYGGAVKAWFVSDIHIKSPEDPKLRIFESWLASCRADGTTHIFLVGDIFDLWVGGHIFFADRYAGVVELIRDLVSRKVAITYFEGNHDLHLQAFWQEELGVHVAVGPEFFDLGPYRVRIEHGDQMNPDDRGYLLLRSVLRTSFMEWVAHALPGRVIQGIGNTMSRSSRKWTSSALKARNEAAIHSMVRTHAHKVYEEEPFDLLVTGHVHVRDDYSWKSSTNETVRSVNLGSWDETAQGFCLEESGGQWCPLA